MNRFLQILFLASFLTGKCLPLNAQSKEVRYELEVDKSSVKWVSKDLNSTYTGTFRIKNGYMIFENGVLNQLVVFVNTQSFVCQKCGEAEDRSKIASYVLSPGFLNEKMMDYAVFKMYEVTPLKDSKDGNYMIKGNMSIKGFTHEISLPVFVETKKDEVSGTGKLTFNRLLWRLENPTGTEAVYTMENNVDLYINLEGKKSQ